MPTVTLSAKHQLTVPVDIVRKLSLKAGDKLIVEAIDWRIVLMKESENTIEQLKGSMKGVYGSTLEEINGYIGEERRGWERDEWREQFDDLIESDSDAKKIVAQLRASPGFTSSEPDLHRMVTNGRVQEVLGQTG